MKIYDNQMLYEMTREDNKVVLVDFDGTLCEHRFPEDPGPPNPDNLDAIARAKDAGWTVILWTGRLSSFYQDNPPNQLGKIMKWLAVNEVKIDGILLEDKPVYAAYLDDNSYNVDDDTSFLLRLGCLE